MKAKTFRYEINNCAKGVLLTPSKRKVKEHCKEMAQIFFPTVGIKTLKIERVDK